MQLFLHKPSARFAEYVAYKEYSHQSPLFRSGKKKCPRAAVWRIYLNLGNKGVPNALHQAIKFPKEKLAHNSAI